MLKLVGALWPSSRRSPTANHNRGISGHGMAYDNAFPCAMRCIHIRYLVAIVRGYAKITIASVFSLHIWAFGYLLGTFLLSSIGLRRVHIQTDSLGLYQQQAMFDVA